MKTWIRNGIIVTDSSLKKADILVEDGKIREIRDRTEEETGTGGQENSFACPSSGREVIDAGGRYILPGAVDIHTHMDLDVGIARVIDNFFSGTVAAACGGTTTIVDHMAFGPRGCSLLHQVDEYHRLADGNAVVDYGFHGVFQHVNDDILNEMPVLAREEGITSFKVYMTYDYMINDLDLMRILTRAKEEGILIASHCENDGIVRYYRERFVREGKKTVYYHPLSRPDLAEAEAVSRFLYLARAAGCAPVYIVHLSSEKGLREVKKARKAGQKYFGVETCPQYLILDDSLYNDPKIGLKALMAPPLRKEKDRAALWDALTHDELDTVATDHCPFTFAKQKQQGAENFTKCPSGAPGVEERLLLLFSEGVGKGRITLPQLVKYACTGPAKAAGLYPRKGAVEEGSDADLVILNPEKEQIFSTERLHGAADYTCYEGMPIRGVIERVLLRGKTIVKDGVFMGKQGDGLYLRRGISQICEGSL